MVEIGQLAEVAVCRFQAGAVLLRASRDQQVGRRDRDAPPPGALCEVEGGKPHCIVDRQLRQHLREFPQDLFLPCASRAVPKFQLNHRAPASVATAQGVLHAAAHGRVAVGAKQVNPG